MIKKNLFLGMLAISTMLSVPSYALIKPSPLATDARIKTVMYSPNEVIRFSGYYRYQSNIEFAAEEQIKTISLGDSVAWQINPVGNRLFIKPIEQDATTNMTVITNKHTYFFELHAGDVKSIEDKNLIFELRIIYPNDESAMETLHSAIDHVPDLEQDDLNKYNFRYTVSGSDDITPIRIFDDGEFTYFQFHDVNAEVPAFFMVDKEGNESVINYRARGPYIVIERVTARYTLRHGKSVVCVFNEAMKDGRAPQKSQSSSWF
ncbi:MAG TPA: P-type conjugative transfer protein VirB9 [Rickettsiales bacterium]|nr:P-type conjugative transfer protein VirB9 [Rickettsiales bacterium]